MTTRTKVTCAIGITLGLLLALLADVVNETPRPSAAPQPEPREPPSHPEPAERGRSRPPRAHEGQPAELPRSPTRDPASTGRAPTHAKNGAAGIVLDEDYEASLDNVETLMENTCIQRRSPGLIDLAAAVVDPLNLAIEEGDDSMVRDLQPFLAVVEGELRTEQAGCRSP